MPSRLKSAAAAVEDVEVEDDDEDDPEDAEPALATYNPATGNVDLSLGGPIAPPSVTVGPDTWGSGPIVTTTTDSSANLLPAPITVPQQGTITLTVSPTLEEGYAVFSVSDTGIGIPASDVQKLFSEFFRVDNEINQNVKGTGLGLVLAKNIVQAHHGKIWVQSQVGTGTTF